MVGGWTGRRIRVLPLPRPRGPPVLPRWPAKLIRLVLAEARDEGEDLVELLLDALADWLLGGFARGDVLPEVLGSLVHGLDQPCPLIIAQQLEREAVHRLRNANLVDIATAGPIPLCPRQRHPSDTLP